MESWRATWRKGIAPILSDDALAALKAAVEVDDQRICQGATTVPPPLQCVSDWPPEEACFISFCGWIGDGLETVGEVSEFFSVVCFECDKILGEPAGIRWFLNWADEAPREEVMANLLPEINREIARRAALLQESS